jgi:hypothetical protein
MFGKRLAITGLTCMVYVALPAWSQSDTAPGSNALQPESKRLLGVVPNYRTSPSIENYDSR